MAVICFKHLHMAIDFYNLLSRHLVQIIHSNIIYLYIYGIWELVLSAVLVYRSSKLTNCLVIFSATTSVSVC